MLQYDKIDMPEGIDINKINDLHEYIICNKWYLLEINFRFYPNVYDVCHNLMQKVLNFNDIAMASLKGND